MAILMEKRGEKLKGQLRQIEINYTGTVSLKENKMDMTYEMIKPISERGGRQIYFDN